VAVHREERHRDQFGNKSLFSFIPLMTVCPVT
jgi:hypothetical protein